jgi:hypothetical protein
VSTRTIQQPSVSKKDGPRGADRRRSTREPVKTIGRLTPIDGPIDESSVEVLITDVSLHGAGFRSSDRIELGRKYYIDIGVGPLHLTSRLVVIRSLRRRDGMYDIGGEFC